MLEFFIVVLYVSFLASKGVILFYLSLIIGIVAVVFFGVYSCASDATITETMRKTAADWRRYGESVKEAMELSNRVETDLAIERVKRTEELYRPKQSYNLDELEIQKREAWECIEVQFVYRVWKKIFFIGLFCISIPEPKHIIGVGAAYFTLTNPVIVETVYKTIKPLGFAVPQELLKEIKEKVND